MENTRTGASSSLLSIFRMVTSIDDVKSLYFWKAASAEFIGTLLLVLVGCGSCNAIDEVNFKATVVQIALCFGLSVATVVWAIGHVSGGHVNPAVTMAMVVTRKISLIRAIVYIVFQCIGAIFGALILKGLTPAHLRKYLGSTLVSSNIQPGQGFGVEIMITFVLVFTVFATCDKKRTDLNGSFPLAIGLSVTMCHLFAVPFTGSSMNTARSFGPAVVMGIWKDHWVYWLGPITGGILAGLVYENIFAVNASLRKAKACLLQSKYDGDKYKPDNVDIKIVEEDSEQMTTESVKIDSDVDTMKKDSV